MTLPVAGSGGGYGDEYSERASSLEDYKVTCMQFVRDISKDYLAWVDYYKLDPEEDAARRDGISSIIPRAEEWIARVAQSIKGVDVVMNDAIQKMAEATAGRPFPINVTVGGLEAYTRAKPGRVDIAITSSGRNGRTTLIGSHSKDARFRIESTFGAKIDESLAGRGAAAAQIELHMDASGAVHNDLVSFTVVVGEHDGDQETERRGVSTLVHID